MMSCLSAMFSLFHVSLSYNRFIMDIKSEHSDEIVVEQTQPGEKQATHEVIIAAKTMDEEFDYVMWGLAKLDFYNQNGYNPAFPDHPAFQEIVAQPSRFKDADKAQLKAIFENEVYAPAF